MDFSEAGFLEAICQVLRPLGKTSVREVKKNFTARWHYESRQDMRNVLDVVLRQLS